MLPAVTDRNVGASFHRAVLWGTTRHDRRHQTRQRHPPISAPDERAVANVQVQYCRHGNVATRTQTSFAMTTRTVTLEQYRSLAADARAALRMVREVVEQHAPPGSVPSEEMVEPPFAREAEALVKGILAMFQRAANACAYPGFAAAGRTMTPLQAPRSCTARPPCVPPDRSSPRRRYSSGSVRPCSMLFQV